MAEKAAEAALQIDPDDGRDTFGYGRLLLPLAYLQI